MAAGRTARCYAARSVLLVAALACVHAQPFMVEEPPFEVGLFEATQRQDINYTGFTFGFNNASAGDNMTPVSSIKQNQAKQNPFLSTLPGDGNGQALVTLGPCSGNNPHTHPRGSEISFMLYGGPIEFGMVEENAGDNILMQETLAQNETIHIPQGILHYSFNPTCQPAAFLANFATKDPGTQTIWASLLRIPTHTLNQATGLPEALISGIKNFPILTTPSTGGEACMKTCGINVNASNVMTPNPPDQDN